MTKTRPLNAKEWYERGNKLKRDGNPTAALDAFRTSIKLNSNVAAPWLGLAQLLDANNQFEDALTCLQQAKQADPRNVLARLRLATSLKDLGYVEEARREYEASIDLEPDSATARFGLGQLFEDLGEPGDAAEQYRQSYRLDKSKLEALSCLLGLGRHTDIESEVAEAQRLLNTLEPRDKALVAYGLGKAFEQQGQYDKALTTFEVANAARRDQAGPFDAREFDARIEIMKSTFTSEFFAARRQWGHSSPQPVFIVGLPRSGTTLTEQIIASHPDCFGAGELNVLTDLATGTPDRLGKPEPSWPLCATDLSNQQVSEIASDYLQQSSVRAPEHVSRIVDKQPLNFWHLGLIALAFPNAHVVHCTRDIRDCGLSIFTQNFNVHQKWSTSFEDIAHYWRGYKALMAHFQTITEMPILEVKYEETVADLETSAQSLLQHIELPWDKRVLAFHEHERAVQTPSRWQVRQPLYSTSMARWRKYEGRLGALEMAAIQ